MKKIFIIFIFSLLASSNLFAAEWSKKLNLINGFLKTDIINI